MASSPTIMIKVLLLLGLHLPYFADSTRYAATFMAANNGIEGTVAIENGYLTIDLDFSGVDTAMLPTPTCLSTLKYHLHTGWTYGDSNDRMGSAACHGDYTGGHYDPYNACGSASSSAACDGSNGGCIPKSAYACSALAFATDVYACEVGDWSGKYDVVTPVNNLTSVTHWSFYEVDGANTAGMSVVFHCGTGSARAFCSNFVMDTANAMYAEYPNQPDVTGYASVPVSLMADFDTLGTIAFMPDGRLMCDAFYIPAAYSSCTSGDLEYAIFDSWVGASSVHLSGNTACMAAVGAQWDPSHQCSTPWSGSAYCINDVMCNDTVSGGYDATCMMTNKFECAPGALSSMYGAMAIDATPETSTMMGGVLPQLQVIAGKSIAFYCADDWMMAACAQIVPVYGSTPGTTDPGDSGAVSSHRWLLEGKLVVFAAAMFAFWRIV